MSWKLPSLTLCLLLLATSDLVSAQTPDKLPPQQNYLGEIRRTPDGKLVAIPEAELAAKNGLATKATMLVGAGEKRQAFEAVGQGLQALVEGVEGRQ